MKIKQIETERLLLREICEKDIDGFHNLCADPKAMEFMPETFCDDKDKSKKRLTLMIERANDPENRDAGFAVIHKVSSTFIGIIGLSIEEGDRRRDGNHRRSLGFFYKSEFWGQGYATEAALAVIEFGFLQLDAHKITGGCITDNIASERVLKKIGLKKEAHFRKHVLHDKEWKDQVWYGLVESDYMEYRSDTDLSY